MRTYAVLIAALLLASGCGSHAVITAQGCEPDHRMKLAVFDFDDSAAYKALRDYTLWGAAGSWNPDILVARAVRRGLAKCPNFDVVDWVDMRRLTPPKDKTSTPGARAITPASDAQALDWGKTLHVEAVAVGTVEVFKQAWFLPLYSRANVAFEVRCLDVATGKELWRIHAEDWQRGAVEEDVAAHLCEELHAQLHAAPKPPSTAKPKSVTATATQGGKNDGGKAAAKTAKGTMGNP